MKRTISGMIGTGSLAHNRRDFIAENVDPDRVQLNICYRNENLKEVYKELFDEAVERYNVGKRKDRQITNYYEKIRQGKQEKLFHEVIFQIGNREDMAVGTEAGDLAVNVLDEYVKDFQKRNPTLRVFSCYLHQDEATPHLHIDFIPYVTDWKGKGMDTRVSLKQGNILEPSCGVGNFMGLIPESMSKTNMYGVELDPVSGRIAKQLYQKNKIPAPHHKQRQNLFHTPKDDWLSPYRLLST